MAANQTKKETTAMNTKLWTTNQGRVCCEKHIGYSATAELQANPKARTLYGSCDTWHRMTKAEINDWTQYLAQYNMTEPCEDCREGF
jgi:hypothetical protein